MIVFVHTKFGLVQLQGRGVKRGGSESAPRPERVFEIPVQIVLMDMAIKIFFLNNT